MHRWSATLLLLAAMASVPRLARAQGPESVLVVCNEAVPGSLDVATRYVAARKVPADQLLRIKTSTAPQVSLAQFEREIQSPIALWLATRGAQDRILYIVLTRGVPLRVAGTPGRTGTSASVDSELALLYRRMTGVTTAPNGPVPNPYFLGNGGIDAAKPFSHAIADIYLVTRLDGFSVADALGLIDRGIAPATDGRFLLDGAPASADVRNTWFETAATRLSARGLGERVVHDETSRALTRETGVLGYASWGSNDPGLAVRYPELQFVNGGLASMFLSSDARTFVEPPEPWKPGRATVARTHAGSTQTLIGDFVRGGVTGVAGNVAEPFLDGTVRPDVLFPSYAAGFNLAEAFYLATPYLSWQTVVVGDPLCAPFRTAALTLAPHDADPPLDPETELPARFSARRLAILTKTARHKGALALLLRADGRLTRGNVVGAVDALETAVFTEPASIAAWRALAMAQEQLNEYGRAAESYRRVLALDRNDVISLNNLAFLMAVRENRAKEALPLATRAAALARDAAIVDDTLGWIHHLLGNDEEALRLLTKASRALTTNAEVQIHAAVVFAATGRLEDAAKALQLATQIDATVKDRPDVRELQRKLAGEGGHAR